jgi:hypothetical protein
MKKLALVFVLSVLMVSCKQSTLSDSFIYFNEPQPVNVDVINSFPRKYQGTFILDNSNLLIVQEKCIFKKQIDTIEIAKKDLDSIPEIQFKDGQVFDKNTNKKYKATIVNDTVSWQQVQIDTVFSFSENEVAKEYKSSLILNKKVDDNYQVSYIKYTNLSNKYIQLGTKKDASLIQNTLKIPRDVVIENSDTTHVILKASRADFRKLLRLDGMEYQTIYRLK